MAVTIADVKTYLQGEQVKYEASAAHYDILQGTGTVNSGVYAAKASAFRNTARALAQVEEFIDGTLEVEAKPVLSGTEEVKGEAV